MAQIDDGHDAHGASPQVLTVGSPTIGEILADRYQVDEHLGNDAHGRQMYRGIDVVLRRPVTIVLRQPGGESAREMLAAAVAASRVVHPHLVGVYDAIDEGERAYVVREWIDGVSLAEAVTDGPMDAPRAVAIAYAVADAVAALHEAGVIHGNIHPGTVMIAQDGRVMLADARASEAVSEATDVRAIGGVLYCALTGFWPHAEAGPAPVPDGVHDRGVLLSPRQVVANVSANLDELTASLLDPMVQAATAAVVSAELAALTEPVEEEDLERPEHFPTFAATAQPIPADSGHRKKIVVAIGILAALALIGTLLALRNGGDSDIGAQPHSSSASGSSKTAPGEKRKIKPSSARIVLGVPAGYQGQRDEGSGADKIIDGDRNSAWRTTNLNSADMHGMYSGMGVLLDLGSPQTVVQVEMLSATPGATAELKMGNSDPGDTQSGDNEIAGNYTSVSAPKVTTTTTMFQGNGLPSRYILIWFTKLAGTNTGGGRVEVNEITVEVQ